MKASAPGKVILFGEHAVVYGRHAVASAIGLRCYVEARKSNDIKIISPLGVTGLDFNTHPYVSYAIKRFCEVKPIKGVEIRIKSDIPIASGLGSSSAVTVAVLKALDGEFEAGLSDEDIYEIARKVEIDVQGIGSGTDPFVCTFGKTWLIPERKLIRLKNKMKILIVNTNESSITAEMVRKVAKLREKYKEIVDRIFDTIDSITLKAIEALEKSDLATLSELVFLNQCMLKAIGVSSKRIDELVEKLYDLKISAKITGAGGGGCVIGIGMVDALEKCVREIGGILIDLDEEGVRFER
ncbi:MAG TPA: mevalonate kinase [Archaeoglobus profundus]|nr:mevalonate kinase [Archaeoglobus profundus]